MTKVHWLILVAIFAITGCNKSETSQNKVMDAVPASKGMDKQEIVQKLADAWVNRPWEYGVSDDQFSGKIQMLTKGMRLLNSNSPLALPMLGVRKSKGEIKVIMMNSMGSYICSASNDRVFGEIIYDDSKPTEIVFKLADNNEALFFVEPTDMINRLKTAKQIFIRVRDECGKEARLEIYPANFAEEYTKMN